MKRMCSDCGHRPVSAEQRGNGGSLCEQCTDWAGWENEHIDNCHQEILDGEELAISEETIAGIREYMVNCPICQNYPHPRDTFKAGHTNTQAKAYTSHADCDHPRTPKAREICRRARRATGVPAQPKGRKAKSVLLSADEAAAARKAGHNV